MFTNYSLKAKLAIPIVLTAFIVLTTMTTYMSIHNWNNAKESAQDLSLAMSHAHANELRSGLENDLMVARLLSQSLQSFKNQNQVERLFAIQFLEDVLKSNTHLVGTWTIWEPNAWDGRDSQYVKKDTYDETGRFVIYVNFNENKIERNPLIDYEKPGDGDYYVVPKTRKRESMIEPYLYPIGDKMTMLTTIAVPIFEEDKLLGVAGVDIALEAVQALIGEIRPYETSTAYLVSSNRAYVSHPDSSLITKPVSYASDELSQKTKEEKDFAIVIKEDDGEEYLYTGSPISVGKTQQTWMLLIKTPMSTILADAKAMLIRQIAIGGVGVLLLLVAIVWLANYLTSVLDKIIAGLRDESAVVTKTSEVVATTSINISEATTQQAASLQETVSSIEEISAMVARNASNATSSVQNSEISTKVALKGKEITLNVMNSIKEIAESNQMSIKQMENSNKEFEQIVEVINNIASKTRVINDIVFQTKLLSFNASVEAARAGESGKGFSVVAEEIGNLATMSGKAANEISELLSESITKVTDTVGRTKSAMDKMMSESKNKVEESLVISTECSGALEEILQNVSSVNEMVKDISHASAEQSVGISEINKAMIELDNATQSSTRAASESSKTAKELMGQAQRLNQLVEELNRLSTGK